jgi:hypothetical protein
VYFSVKRPRTCWSCTFRVCFKLISMRVHWGQLWCPITGRLFVPSSRLCRSFLSLHSDRRQGQRIDFEFAVFVGRSLTIEQYGNLVLYGQPSHFTCALAPCYSSAVHFLLQLRAPRPLYQPPLSSVLRCALLVFRLRVLQPELSPVVGAAIFERVLALVCWRLFCLLTVFSLLTSQTQSSFS